MERRTHTKRRALIGEIQSVSLFFFTRVCSLAGLVVDESRSAAAENSDLQAILHSVPELIDPTDAVSEKVAMAEE